MYINVMQVEVSVCCSRCGRIGATSGRLSPDHMGRELLVLETPPPPTDWSLVETLSSRGAVSSEVLCPLCSTGDL